jgi:hypothetical protein
MREVVQRDRGLPGSPVPTFTRRDVKLPAVPRKAVAVIAIHWTCGSQQYPRIEL